MTGRVCGGDDGEPARAAVIAALRGVPAFAREDVSDVTQLESMTNTVYRARVGARTVVVRTAVGGTDPVVDRAAEVANIQVAAARGLAPAIVYADPSRQVLVTAFVEAQVLTHAGVRREDHIERIGALLARVHRLDAARFRGRFDPTSMIDRYRDWLAAAGNPIDDADAALVTRAQQLCAVLSSAADVVPCHNDGWPPNILDAGSHLMLVDWEFSGLGDPLWDLTHIAVETELDPDQTDRLLWAWCDGAPSRQVLARLTLWRPVSDVVWALWARVQHGLGNRRLDLNAYAVQRLERARRGFDDEGIGVALSALAPLRR